MRTLRCIAGSWSERTFASPEEAIAYRSPRSNQAEQDTQGLKGTTIQDGLWTNTQFAVALSNGKVLKIGLEREKVTWSICGLPLPNSSDAVDREPVCLELTSETHPEPLRSTWDRERLLRARIGRKFQMLFAGDAFLYLYIEGEPILLFSRWIQLDHREDLLHWEETD